MKNLITILILFMSVFGFSQSKQKYSRHGKLTQSQIDGINVSDNSVIYTAYNTSAQREEINTGSGWVARNSGSGSQGPQGPQGIQGEKGDQGIQGVQGAQGVQGEIGPQGPSGQNGTGGSGTPQTLSLAGTNNNQLSISGGNTVTLPTGGGTGTTQTAAQVSYVNTTSSLASTNVQSAVDELETKKIGKTGFQYVNGDFYIKYNTPANSVGMLMTGNGDNWLDLFGGTTGNSTRVRIANDSVNFQLNGQVYQMDGLYQKDEDVARKKDIDLAVANAGFNRSGTARYVITNNSVTLTNDNVYNSMKSSVRNHFNGTTNVVLGDQITRTDVFYLFNDGTGNMNILGSNLTGEGLDSSGNRKKIVNSNNITLAPGQNATVYMYKNGTATFFDVRTVGIVN